MESFDELLFGAMDDTVRLVFGEATYELIYALMERHLRLKREEVRGEIDVFYAFLERLLGSKGAHVIKATSIKCLCLKLRREYKDVEEYFSVLDELYEIKFKLLIHSLREESSVCNRCVA